MGISKKSGYYNRLKLLPDPTYVFCSLRRHAVITDVRIDLVRVGPYKLEAIDFTGYRINFSTVNTSVGACKSGNLLLVVSWFYVTATAARGWALMDKKHIPLSVSCP